MGNTTQVVVEDFRKGQEGKGYDYYVIKSVETGLYLNRQGEFTDVGVGINTQLFHDSVQVSTRAAALGFVIVKLPEQ